jgi:glycosyltransferase involved in cell wall biosynthesis
VKTVSVVIPTFNCADRVVRALQSVAAQTYPLEHIQAVVVDDGSTDHTTNRIAEFTANSALSVRYVRQENAGPAAARNHAMRLARGECIAFLDADDEWQPAKLERQLPLLTGSVGLVYCANSFIDADGVALENYAREIELYRGDILLPLFCDFFLLTSAVILKRSVFDVVKPFDESLSVGEDYDLFLRIAQHFHADHSPEKLLIRCVRPDSLSRLDYVKDARTDLSTLARFLRDNPDFAQRNRVAAAKRLAQCHYDFGYRLLSDNRRAEAIRELWESFQARPTLAAARTAVRAMISSKKSSDSPCIG